MTSTQGRPEAQKSTFTTWRTRIIGGAAVLAVLVIVYFILAAFIPRWWAQRVASMVHGSFGKGIGWGLFYGGLLTVIPLFLLLLAALTWRRKAGKVIAGAAGALAVLIAIPNLMTLSIVLGDNSAAHAGQRILDVDAPAFRGAALVGAITAAIVFLFALALVARRGWRRKHPAKPVPETPAVKSAPLSGDLAATTEDTRATHQEGM
ncbi:permease [Nocardia australiensis]|uniref:permease n=1 Tax=Nocardia australiensis TaxID=2887191 RepID=UPI001D134D14|nr:permease [Nocardia australiensis]